MTGQVSRIASLPLLAQGKVRDLHAVDERLLLMVASDRLSAFDVVMEQPLPGKGTLLTRMSNFWFGKLAAVCPNHLTGIDPEAVVAAHERPLVRGRATVVKRLQPILVEAVVRGFLAGSGWQEYQARGSVCGVPLPASLRKSERLPQPIFTPVQKAPAGEHDRNITFAELDQLVGPDLARRIERASIALYVEASAHAQARGLFIADTKFEFGLDVDGTLTLMDEVLTPDSSRFWPVETYRVGVDPPGFDKQLLRNWLEQARVGGSPWNKRSPAPAVPHEVLHRTLAIYHEAFERLCS